MESRNKMTKPPQVLNIKIFNSRFSAKKVWLLMLSKHSGNFRYQYLMKYWLSLAVSYLCDIRMVLCLRLRLVTLQTYFHYYIIIIHSQNTAKVTINHLPRIRIIFMALIYFLYTLCRPVHLGKMNDWKKWICAFCNINSEIL